MKEELWRRQNKGAPEPCGFRRWHRHAYAFVPLHNFNPDTPTFMHCEICKCVPKNLVAITPESKPE